MLIEGEPMDIATTKRNSFFLAILAAITAALTGALAGYCFTHDKLFLGLTNAGTFAFVVFLFAINCGIVLRRW
jgi:hypothetical protein